jgi:hypothetical protein
MVCNASGDCFVPIKSADDTEDSDEGSQDREDESR